MYWKIINICIPNTIFISFIEDEICDENLHCKDNEVYCRTALKSGKKMWGLNIFSINVTILQ